MAISLDEQIPWDEGKHHEVGWILLIIFLTLGTLMNFLQILVHVCFKKMWELPNAPTILALAIQDGVFDFLCLITCTMSFHASRFGGDSMCLWQGLYAEFLMAWSGLSICSLYYSCYANIVEGRTLSTKQVMRIQGGMAAYCLLLTILGVVYPGKPLLNSAGLFCYTATQRLPEGIVFYIGYLTPMFIGLIYMNWKLEHGVSKMKQTMSEYGLTIKPRPLQMALLKSMKIYVAVMILCYSPVLSVSLYAWITGDHQPPIMWIIFGISGHANTVINPILYYILSSSARTILFNKLHNIFGCRCLQDYETWEYNFTDQMAYSAYFDVLIRSKAGKETVRKLAEQHFSPELPKFYFDDHPAWLNLCDAERPSKKSSPNASPELYSLDGRSAMTTEVELTHLTLTPTIATMTISSPTTIPSELGDSSRVGDVSQMSSEPLKVVDEDALDKMATYIYRTYIEDRAPLSLNLPNTLRQDVEDRLFGFGGTSILASRDPHPGTIFVEVNKVVRELIFNNLYNSAFNSKEVRDGFSAHQRITESSHQGPL